MDNCGKIVLYEEKEFKAIPGYNGYYASKDGQIYSDYVKRTIKIQKNPGVVPYYVISVVNNKKHCSLMVHKAVALAWVDIPKNYSLNEVVGNFMSKKLVVDHIDGNKANNNADNLRWCTFLENLNFDNYERKQGGIGNKNAKGRRITDKEHLRYIYIYNNKEFSLSNLAKELNCSKSRITEAFRMNSVMVSSGTITRRIKEKNETKTNSKR